MKDYGRCVDRYMEFFKPIIISSQQTAKIRKFVNELIKFKKEESHHKIDYGNESTRFFTGILGEVAVENYLGTDLVDWTIGDSSIYNIADLSKIGLNIGVKTVEYGKFPIIHREPQRAEIINIKMSDNLVFICGFAPIEVLKTYQDDSLVLLDMLKSRGTKTGFYGFNSLIPFYSMKELALRIGA